MGATVIVQCLDQPKSVKTCKDLYNYFCKKVTSLSNRYEEIQCILIFDRYDIEYYSKQKLKLLLILLDQFQARQTIMLEGVQ